jgi:hypothetical protein
MINLHNASEAKVVAAAQPCASVANSRVESGGNGSAGATAVVTAVATATTAPTAVSTAVATATTAPTSDRGPKSEHDVRAGLDSALATEAWAASPSWRSGVRTPEHADSHRVVFSPDDEVGHFPVRLYAPPSTAPASGDATEPATSDATSPASTDADSVSTDDYVFTNAVTAMDEPERASSTVVESTIKLCRDVAHTRHNPPCTVDEHVPGTGEVHPTTGVASAQFAASEDGGGSVAIQAAHDGVGQPTLASALTPATHRQDGDMPTSHSDERTQVQLAPGVSLTGTHGTDAGAEGRQAVAMGLSASQTQRVGLRPNCRATTLLLLHSPSTAAGVYVVDPDTRLRLANKAAGAAHQPRPTRLTTVRGNDLHLGSLVTPSRRTTLHMPGKVKGNALPPPSRPRRLPLAEQALSRHNRLDGGGSRSRLAGLAAMGTGRLRRRARSSARRANEHACREDTHAYGKDEHAHGEDEDMCTADDHTDRADKHTDRAEEHASPFAAGLWGGSDGLRLQPPPERGAEGAAATPAKWGFALDPCSQFRSTVMAVK